MIKALDAGQCDPRRVDGRDGLIVRADIEEAVEVLSDGADVLFGEAFVIPAGDGQLVDLAEYFVVVVPGSAFITYPECLGR